MTRKLHVLAGTLCERFYSREAILSVRTLELLIATAKRLHFVYEYLLQDSASAASRAKTDALIAPHPPPALVVTA